MAALFPPWSNTPYRVALVTAALVPLVLVAAPMLWIRSDYGTHEGEAIEQPVEFDHRHHVRDDGIDCLYCHPGAERRAIAGIPPTEVCMGCHGQVWNDSPLLAPVRASWELGEPIPWRRVHALPDHVYFHHGVHTQAGVPCASCHGDVASMARVHRVRPLTMGWCLDCHRDPPGPVRYGRRITHLTTCTACHR
ncbi:MAG: cytochrome c family protein [Deltaproteobacteria bacterium]|nr:cytochrome c family protein [Kofleriaceae bacterium]